MTRMVVNSVRQDLVSFNEYYNCVALCAVANIGSKEMAEALHADVFKLLVAEYAMKSEAKVVLMVEIALQRAR